MKKIFFLFALLYLCSCGMNNSQSHDKQAASATVTDSLNVMSHTYEGIIPCADCEGIQYRLTLNHGDQMNNGTYESTMTYLGTNTGKNEVFNSSGKWESMPGNASGEVIYRLDPENPENTSYLLFRGDSLTMLDRDMKLAESELNYTLKGVK